MTDEKKEKMNELMNRISFALKDATLQQGFEIICKRISKLEKENIILRQQSEVEKLKAQIEKMKNVGNCKHTMQCPDWVEHHIKGDNIKCCLNCDKWEMAE